jgi:Na+/melibiose symporter-like transporter
MHSSDASPWTIRGLYLLALVLVASPASDLISTVWPLLPGDSAWRYGFLGLSAGYVLTPLLGVVLAAAVAHWSRDATALRVMAVVMLAGAAVLLVAMTVFALDVVQMRELRAEEVREGIVVGAVLQELKYGAAVLVLASLAIGALRSAPGLGRAAQNASRIVSSPRGGP